MSWSDSITDFFTVLESGISWLGLLLAFGLFVGQNVVLEFFKWNYSLCLIIWFKLFVGFTFSMGIISVSFIKTCYFVVLAEESYKYNRRVI